MKIRQANIDTDFEVIWEIFHEVIKTADTYVFDPKTPKIDLSKHWFADYMNTFVVEIENQIVGNYIIKPNQIDLGNHIANCSYMVHPQHNRKGVGGAMCQHSIDFARSSGYVGIQFNIVISTNSVAVNL